MRRKLLLLASLGLAVLSGCKKEQTVVPRAVVPTATPVPDKDILGFIRRGGLWAMHFDGSEQKLIAQPGQGQALWFPAPSPAGDHLIAWLSRADGTQDVARVDLSGRVTVLTEIGVRAKPLMKSISLGNAPSYSPDGKRIAYSFNGDLWLMDANGYNAETFIGDGASWSPQFSPDGKRIAYINGTEGHFDVWMADLQSRDTWQVTSFTDYTVGQLQWNKDGSGLLMTRCQGEDSDVVQLTLPKDASDPKADLSAPLADADPLTKDRLSGGAVWDPAGRHILFSSGRDNSGLWNIYTADSIGGNAKQLTHDGGYTPFWMRPDTAVALVDLAPPSRPTPAAPQPTAMPTAVPTPVPAPHAQAEPASAVPATPKPAVASPAAASPKPANTPGASSVVPPSGAAPAAPSKPAAPAVVHPVVVATASNPAAPGASAGNPSAAAAPTQPPVKAAPLRLRLKTGFSDAGSMNAAGLAELKKLAPRVSQYASESITIIGPLDPSPLRGKYASEEDRSLARAKAVAKQLTKAGSLKPGVAVAQAYAPPTAGSSGSPNSIQIYVELK
jgi:hypothetical protein